MFAHLVCQFEAHWDFGDYASALDAVAFQTWSAVVVSVFDGLAVFDGRASVLYDTDTDVRDQTELAVFLVVERINEIDAEVEG